MKYKILTQISEFLSKFNKISTIKRVGDLMIAIKFDGSYELIFDLNKSHSSIYKSDQIQIKEYKAPFDILLKKRLNSAKILSIQTLPNNRILAIKTAFSGSYKQVISTLYLEFTGRFTNAIICDENGVILEALSHFENAKRSIKVGKILTLLDEVQIKEKPSEIIEDFDRYFIDEFSKITLNNLNLLKANKIANLDKKIEILNRNLSILETSQELENRAKELNEMGNLIISNLHNLSDYERDLRLIDYAGNEVQIKIDTQPKIAANEMFKTSKKLKQKASNIEIQKENLLTKLEFLNSLKNAISSSSDISEIEILSPKKQGQKSQDKFSDLVENFYINGYKISLGKSQKGNEFLLKNAKKDDFWFHLKDRPSTHVIIKSNKQNLSDEVALFAAKLCAKFSTKSAGVYEVDYTKRQNVKIQNGAFVNYINYKTISIKI
ncbi:MULTISPECIES: NFACT RNA binding domain-containing protein [Campylobacter]|uniref:NFACT RNA binding domain-containing protein n=1 Tax=Campylobacter TaxID=194 RepID=UPI000A32B73A|nr:NFACT RNA binding domain-containing protein [Campylobacter sp. P0024]MCR8679807.1 NFACT RNA binding domain-containing protein [Campylobacter sp. RM19072]